MVQKKGKISELLKYPAIFFIVVICYMIWRICMDQVPELVVKLIMASGAAMCFIVSAMILKRSSSRGEIDADTVVKLVIIAGIIMRIGYMLLTPCDLRGHDMKEFEINSRGHAAYILNIVENGSLPGSNRSQFYQQPFFYLLGGGVSWIVNRLLNCSDVFYIVDAAKTISCAASCMMLMLSEKMCDMLGLGKKGKLAAVTLTAFVPALFLACRVNCDALAGLFLTLAFMYTIRWRNYPSWKNTVILAFVYGCGVMTKISVAVMALFTLIVFIAKLVGVIRKKERSTCVCIMLKYLVFGMISLPLGLWYSVRNFIKFQQPLTYVPAPGETSSLFTGDHSLLGRFLFPNIKTMFERPYIHLKRDYNMFEYSVKTACFGEFKYDIPSVISILLEWAGYVLAVCVLASVVKIIIREFTAKKNGRKPEWSMLITIAVCGVFCASLLVFYYRFPYTCSMDFRYMLFLVAPGAVVLARYCELCKAQWFRNTVRGSLAVFVLSSCTMFIWAL